MCKRIFYIQKVLVEYFSIFLKIEHLKKLIHVPNVFKFIVTSNILHKKVQLC